MNLLSICQVVYDEVFPNATAQTSVKREHVIETGKGRYAYEMWLQQKNAQNLDGGWDIPSVLLREAELIVANNEADISDLKVFRSFEGDIWMNISVFDSDCEYSRHSVNMHKILNDDEYLGNSKPYVIIGKKIKFPKGAHSNKVPIVYASNGEDLDDNIEVDDAIGALVSDYLWKRYTNRLPEDRSNDSNTNKP